MSKTLAPPIPKRTATGSVLVACPDARPPAYQAAAGLSGEGLLGRFVTSYYYRERGAAAITARRVAPSQFAAIEPKLARRRNPDIPCELVRSYPGVDLALALENRSGQAARHAIARWRTRRFDRSVRHELRLGRPDAALIFSDVGSEFALPYCREAGIKAIVSMVHGDVREEMEVLERERERSPDFFPIYLGDGPVDRRELGWLHDRRLCDLEFADLILVPSDHIARTIIAHGTPADRVRVVPYAADTSRFRPPTEKPHDSSCFFLFAGGITQRKGIKYLLEAWRKIRRPGWRLGLVGGLPRDSSPLQPYRDEVEFLGRVGHADMPAIMNAADVFVFPSLFEGSAVVTYEALASGLPSVVTAESGSVARHERDGFLVEAGNVESLAIAMEKLGSNPDLRAAMSQSARKRAEQFDWSRYHASSVSAIQQACHVPAGAAHD